MYLYHILFCLAGVDEDESDWFYLEAHTATSTGQSLELTYHNVTECLQACIDLTSFTCLSVVMYKVDNPDTPSCTLYDTDRYSEGHSLSADPTKEYWEKQPNGILVLVNTSPHLFSIYKTCEKKFAKSLSWGIKIY